MKPRLRRIAKWIAYPAFYLFSLALFGYLTFPYDQLKGRVIAEFDKLQAKSQRRSRSLDPPMRLEIDELDGHWLTGVEVTGARLIIPPKTDLGRPRVRGKAKPKATENKPNKPDVIAIQNATARVRVLPLLAGRVTIDFWAEVFDGEVRGTVPYGSAGGDAEVELEGLQLADVTPLRSLLEGMPVMGVLGGTVQLTPKDGKFAKADGKLELRIDDVVLGDGKTKIQGVALPAAQVGQITISANAKDGLLKLENLSAQGRDFELDGSGKVKLHESWDRSQADVLLKFKFADGYRDKSEATRSLLGKPGDKFPPVIEVAPGSKFKQAKTGDGYYQFHLIGPLSKMDFKPAGAGKTKRPRGRRTTTTTRPRTKVSQKLKKLNPRARPPADESGDESEERVAPRGGSPPDSVGVNRPAPKVGRRTAPPAADREPAEEAEGPAESEDEDKH